MDTPPSDWVAHSLVPEGTGAITQHRMRPLCMPTARFRMVYDFSHLTEEVPANACPDCERILAAIEDCKTRHPAGRARS